MTAVPRAAYRQATGLWWRYSRYEIHGDYIRPAPGAELKEFDPSKWPRSGKADRPPFLELAWLVRDVPTDRLPSPVPIDYWPVDLHRGLLDWCRRYGLLGLLPHTLLSARLGNWQLHRAGASWVKSATFPDEEYEPWSEVVESEFGDGVSVTDEGGWLFYFPDEKPKSRRPSTHSLEELQLLPTSKEFWRAYGEPFEYFVRVACLFSNALRVIGDSARKSIDEYGGATLDYAAALARLNAFAAPVSAGVAVSTNGAYQPVWHSPSLLGHLAMQAIQDLLGERSIRTCPCGVLFSSIHYRTRHCGKTCADRYRQRAHRASPKVAGRKGKVRQRNRSGSTGKP